MYVQNINTYITSFDYINIDCHRHIKRTVDDRNGERGKRVDK